MQRLQEIFRGITQLTSNIATNYPELYRNLDEDPITINTIGHQPDQVDFEDYLNSLKAKLRTYMESKHVNKTSK